MAETASSDSSPCPGEFRARLGIVTKPRVDAGVVLNQTAEEPDHVREAVEIGEDLGLDDASVFDEAHNGTFGPTADRACHLIGCRLGVAAGERPVCENALGGFDLMDEISQFLDVLGGDNGRLFPALRRRSQSGPDAKECALDLFGPPYDVFVLADAASKSENGVELVDRAVGFDTQVGLRDTDASGETGLASVTAFR